MPYPRHWLLSFGGHQGHAEEQWACNIRMAMFGVIDPLEDVDEEQWLTNTGVPGLSGWFNNAGAKIASCAYLKWIKLNEIGPDGRYVDTGNTHERLTLNVAGLGGLDELHPLQVSYCLTWHSNDVDRGPASIGRIYMPRPNVAIDANGDVTLSARNSVASAAAAMLNTLDVGLGSPGGAVFRPALVSPIGEGQARQIDFVTVDSRCDIQRRRASSQSREGSTQYAVTY